METIISQGSDISCVGWSCVEKSYIRVIKKMFWMAKKTNLKIVKKSIKMAYEFYE